MAMLWAIPQQLSAQTYAVPHPLRYSPTTMYLAQEAHSGTMNKSTAADIRMISAANLNYTSGSFSPIDSFSLTYSGAQGGYLNEREHQWYWYYDTATQYPFIAGVPGAAYSRYRQTFNAAGYMDTAINDNWNGVTMQWAPLQRTVYVRDADGRIITEQNENYASGVWNGYMRLTYTYTGTGKIATCTEDDYNTATTTWEPYSKLTNTWDAADRLTIETSQSWNTATLAWYDTYRTLFSYDGADNRITELRENYSGTSWDTTWQILNRDFAMLHQPRTSVTMGWNPITHTPDSAYRNNYIYNAYGKPDLHYFEEWNTGTGTWDIATSWCGSRFHYETIPASVKDAPAGMATIKLYPVPAANELHLSVVWQEAQPFAATITDMQGKTYTGWTSGPRMYYTETIPISHLPPGHYILTLVGKQGKISEQFSVIK